MPSSVPDPLRLVHLLHSELSRRRRQLHPGQSAADPAAYRAGMVLSAVLRDPAFDPVKARRRHLHVRRDPAVRLPALARPLAGASATYRPAFRIFFWLFVATIIGLGYIGSQPPEGGFILAGRILTISYFSFFFIGCHCSTCSRSRESLPASIAEAVLAKSTPGKP